VHCTHGFNRTGFLICSYLVEKLDYSIDMAVSLFAESRPPGIYKQDYLNDLYARYADDDTVPKLVAPPYPQWDNNYNSSKNDSDSDENSKHNSTELISRKRRGIKRQRTEEINKNSQFAEPNLEGIEVCRDLEETFRIRREMQSMCNWNG
jgi:mRNA-capping enzyme